MEVLARSIQPKNTCPMPLGMPPGNSNQQQVPPPALGAPCNLLPVRRAKLACGAEPGLRAHFQRKITGVSLQRPVLDELPGPPHARTILFWWRVSSAWVTAATKGFATACFILHRASQAFRAGRSGHFAGHRPENRRRVLLSPAAARRPGWLGRWTGHRVSWQERKHGLLLSNRVLWAAKVPRALIIQNLFPI